MADLMNKLSKLYNKLKKQGKDEEAEEVKKAADDIEMAITGKRGCPGAGVIPQD